MTQLNNRTPSPGAEAVDPMFLDRWSTRAFSSEPISQEDLDALFEAARWAPSSTNSQPWEFIYATDGEERELFNSLLRPGNQGWATSAPVIAFLITAKGNDEGRVYRTHQFDAGAAWMSLALQARKLGLFTRAMGGIEIDQVHEKLNISRDEYDVMIGIAIGRRGDPSQMSEDLQQKEQVRGRKPLSEVARRWRSS